jgi:PAS domain S-box-containing protein
VDSEAAYVAAIQEDPLDIILADFYLPQFDALRALDLLKAHHRDIPLLVVTGTMGQDAAVQCLKEGAADYLIKDRLARLGAAVERALQEQALRDNQRAAVTALRESERRYRLLAEHATDMISRHALDGTYRYASPACRRLLGYEPEELVGRDPYSLIHPEDQDAVHTSHTTIMDQPIIYTVEYRLRRKDGTYVWAETTSKSIPDPETGAVTEIISVTRDITARIETQEELRLFKALVEASQEAIAITDADGCFVYVNPAHGALFGRSLEEAQKANYRDYYPPASVKLLNQEVVPALQRGEGWEGILDAYDAEGRRFPLWERAGALLDREGKLRYGFSFMHDVTEQVRAEQVLRESERLHRKILEGSNDVLYRVHLPTQTYEYLSPSAQKVLGYPAHHVMDIGLAGLLDHLHPKDQVEQRAHLQRLQQGDAEGGTHTAVYRLQDNVGRYHWISDRHRVICDADGEPEYLVGNARDITEQRQAEETLRQSLQTSADIVQAIPSGLFIYRYAPPDRLVLIDANPAAGHLTGLNPEDWIGHEFDELWPMAREQGITEAFLRVAKTGTPYKTEDLHYADERLEGAFEIHVFPMPRDRIGVAFENITERKRMQAELRKREERFRALVQNSSDIIVLLEADGHLRYISPTVERVLGYSPEQVAHADPFEYLHPDDVAGTRDKLAWAIAHPGSPVLHELRVRAADGNWVYIETITNSLLDVPSVGGVVINARDITERKHGEQERQRLLTQIREQAQQVQKIIDTVPEGVVLLNTEGRVLRANPLGTQDLDYLASAEVGDVVTHLGGLPLDVLLTSPPKGLWHTLTVEDRHYQVIARSIETGPTPGNWVMVFRDVTQQQESERRVHQQERLAAVGQLAAGIAHDFNNIMATIVLYAQMTARAPKLPEHDQERLAVISQQAKYATNLIQQILDFSRSARLERRPFDLLPLLKEQVKLLQRTLPESIKIDLTYGRDDYTIDADPTRMQQVFMNLAVNARDAMPEGGRLHLDLTRFHVERRREAPLPEITPGDWIRVTVEDTGCGIPEDVLPHIYEPFFTTKPPGQGSGLGLSQVYGIISQHDGAIAVDSQVPAGPEQPGGTRFTLYLPAIPAPSSDPATLGRPDLPQGTGETILVVEDNRATRNALVESLELLNYRVLQATQGREALDILADHADEIDLILSDVVMPEMGGIALLHDLQRRAYGIHVILLTGHPLQKELEELQEQGGLDLLREWIFKPPSLEQLAKALARAIQGER